MASSELRVNFWIMGKRISDMWIGQTGLWKWRERICLTYLRRAIREIKKNGVASVMDGKNSFPAILSVEQGCFMLRSEGKLLQECCGLGMKTWLGEWVVTLKWVTFWSCYSESMKNAGTGWLRRPCKELKVETNMQIHWPVRSAAGEGCLQWPKKELRGYLKEGKMLSSAA